MHVYIKPKWKIGDRVYVKLDGRIQLRKVTRWHANVELLQELDKPLDARTYIEYETVEPARGTDAAASFESELFPATVEGFAIASGESKHIPTKPLTFWETFEAWWTWVFPETAVNDEDDRDR